MRRLRMDIFDAFAPLSPAEDRLLAQCGTSDRITFDEGELPSAETPTNTLRAGVLRALLLGLTSHAVDPKGLRLRGAWISGTLDLQGADCGLDITFTNCRLNGVNMVNAQLRGLHVSGCHMRGFIADNARFSGSVFLRDKTYVSGEISLSGARISGDLQVCEVEIESPEQDAIFAPSLRVEGSVFLGNYPYSEGETALVANGAIFLSSARVDHDVFATHLAIGAKDAVGNNTFDDTEEHGSDIALSLARGRDGGVLYLEDNQITRGIVNLAGAYVARLKDEPEGPGASYPIRLDGFRYDDFSRHADTNLEARLGWLERRPAGVGFVAQPYEQLALVFGKLGHRLDARATLMRKEDLLRKENRRMMKLRGQHILHRLKSMTDPVMRFLVGYGYRPARAVGLAAVLIVALGWFFQQAWNAGDMTPNSAPVLISQPWVQATIDQADNPGAFWSSAGEAGQDWETFNAYAYAADLVIPIINLGQESAWAPSTSRSDWGRAGWWIRWFAKVIGWMVTALGAAAITVVIRNE